MKTDQDENKNEFQVPTFTEEWFKNEKENFEKVLDKNGDGYLNLEEIIGWTHPKDYNPAEAEATWLMDNADLDKNGYLNTTEILIKYSLFVESSVTEWGASLLKHDEL